MGCAGLSQLSTVGLSAAEGQQVHHLEMMCMTTGISVELQTLIGLLAKVQAVRL